MDMTSEFDRLLFFEHARRTAETTYGINPLDADNLTRWGGVLLELSQFQSGPESKMMVQDAIEKLEEALVVNPTKHDALWCLGNAYTSNAFLTPDLVAAEPDFDKAAQCFAKAYALEPTNDLYKKSVEVSEKASAMHRELHLHGLAQQLAGPQATRQGGPGSTSTKQQSGKKNKTSDLKYDVFGWVILAVGIVVWVGIAKSNMPPPPPR